MKEHQNDPRPTHRPYRRIDAISENTTFCDI